MAESVVMIIFFAILILIQYTDRKNIIIPSKKNKIILLISIIISSLILIIFWPEIIYDQIKLVLLSALILNFSFAKEGLGKEKIIKSGFLDTKYESFEKIEIEAIDEYTTSITFYKRKKDNTGTTVVTDYNLERVKSFFVQQNLQVVLEKS